MNRNSLGRILSTVGDMLSGRRRRTTTTRTAPRRSGGVGGILRRLFS